IRSHESSQNQRDLPTDNSLVSVEVLRYDTKKSKSENKEIMSTKMEQYWNKPNKVLVMESRKDENPARANIKQALGSVKVKELQEVRIFNISRSRKAVLANESSQPQSLYEVAATLTEFELKKILIDKMDKSKSYLAAPEHKECYKGLKKSYDLDKTIFSNYGKVYSLKKGRKDKDEDPSTGSDRGLKKRKTSKDAEPAKGPKAKESYSSSSKGDNVSPLTPADL
nr:hypothetical protein [Tanacetum cinerariifolium]